VLRKLALWVGLLLGGAMLLGFLLVCGTAAYIWYDNTYKTVIQVVELQSQRKQFVLLTDLSGFDDRSWYVYQLDLGASLTPTHREGHNSDGALFWNYSEAGEHKGDPHIRLVAERFLVFTRGGLDHSLYDLKSNRVLINATSSWGAAIAKPDLNLSPQAEAIVIDKWVRENLHGPIQALIKNAT
jgi:hypothetical protein